MEDEIKREIDRVDWLIDLREVRWKMRSND
jgi:hypothetical protein